VTGLSRKRSRLAELWPADQRHLAAARIAEWFATYVHLPKPHDRVVSETGSATRSPGSIRNSRMQRGPTKPPIYRAPLAKGPRTGRCRKPPCWCGRRVASAQLRPAAPTPNRRRIQRSSTKAVVPFHRSLGGRPRTSNHGGFFGSVEIDTVRPVKAFEAILNAHGRLLVLTLRLPV
jgi:hypothetical protein